MSHNISCVFENALARPKKIRYTARTRVRDVEEKLDGLIALISARKEALAQDAALAPETAEAVPQATVTDEMPFLDTAPAPDFFSAPAETISFNDLLTEPAPPPPVSIAPYPSSPMNDVVGRGLVSEEKARQLLDEYMTTTGQLFPFVLLPPTVTLSSMRRERPFVLLAILAVTMEFPHQERLALEFRKALAQTMIVESKNSLDLLQGILIFCTWHHRYFTPLSSQLYQLSQIAVTMAVDLNLGNKLSQFFSDFSTYAQPSQFSVASKRTTDEYQTKIEEARTYIGTYCISASVATAHRKPTHFKFDRKVGHISQVLSSMQAAPSDALLLHHVRVRKLTEEVDRVFDTNNINTDAVLDATYIDTMVKDFERQYAQIRDSAPAEAWDNSSMRFIMTYLPVTIYQVGLRTPSSHQFSMQSAPTAPCCNWCASSTRLSIIMKCIHAAQSFITSFLDLPDAVFRKSTIMEVSNHIDAILVLARASSGSNAKHFHAGNTMTEKTDFVGAVNLEHYLELSEKKATCMVTCATSADGTSQTENNDVFFKLREVFRFGLTWYCRFLAAKQGHIPSVKDMADQKLRVPSLFWLDEVSGLLDTKCPHVAMMVKTNPGCYLECGGGTEDGMDEMMRELNACEKIMQAEPCLTTDVPVPDVFTGPASVSTSGSATDPGTGSGSATGTGSLSASPSEEDPGAVPNLDFEDTQPWASEMDPWSSILQSSVTSQWFGM